MWKRSNLLCVLAVTAAVTSSCIFDPKKDPGDDVVPPKGILPLTTRVAVLNNLEVSYNNRNITQYENLLDNGFTFFLAPGDVGGNVPAQWDRSEEIIANTRLFSKTKEPTDPWPLCTSIQMDVKFEGTIQWITVIPAQAPDETWYTTTLFYSFQIDVEPDRQLIPDGSAKSQFTVRNAGTEESPRWQLVEWRDLGSGS